MRFQPDVARIKAGDTVTAEFKFYTRQYEITGAVTNAGDNLMLGPFTLSYSDEFGIYPNANLLRVIDHQPAPAPLYANRPDITEPRPYDVVEASSGGDSYVYRAFYYDGTWRTAGGGSWDTESLLEVGTLTLVGAAIP